MCVCLWHTRAKCFFGRVCGVFNVYIWYLTKLKLASGNAHYCNDRSGADLKEEMYFFNV